MLSFTNLQISRNHKPLFSQLGFTLSPGAALVIKGPNGSGKTTLLKILAGLVRPDDGVVTWNSVDIHELPDVYATIIQYVGHQLALKLQLTVRENICFYAELAGTPMLEDAAIRYFSLDPYVDTPCYQLSAGWKQRVALARLLACNAKLWLLDEPSANLDEEGKRLLTNLLNIRCSEGGTVVLTSHEELKLSEPVLLPLEEFA